MRALIIKGNYTHCKWRTEELWNLPLSLLMTWSKPVKIYCKFIPMPMKSETKQCKSATKSALKKWTRKVFNIIFVHIGKPSTAVHRCLHHGSFRKILTDDINKRTPVAKAYCRLQAFNMLSMLIHQFICDLTMALYSPSQRWI